MAQQFVGNTYAFPPTRARDRLLFLPKTAVSIGLAWTGLRTRGRKRTQRQKTEYTHETTYIRDLVDLYREVKPFDNLFFRCFILTTFTHVVSILLFLETGRIQLPPATYSGTELSRGETQHLCLGSSKENKENQRWNLPTLEVRDGFKIFGRAGTVRAIPITAPGTPERRFLASKSASYVWRPVFRTQRARTLSPTARKTSMPSSPTELELAKQLLSHVHRGNRKGAESALAAGATFSSLIYVRIYIDDMPYVAVLCLWPVRKFAKGA